MKNRHNRKTWKRAICPLCGNTHAVEPGRWLTPVLVEFIGLYTGFHCEKYDAWVSKFYTSGFEFICYLVTFWDNDEIPF